MRRIVTFALLAAIAIWSAHPVLSQEGAGNSREKTEAELASKTLSVDFTAAPLSEVIEYLQKTLKLYFVFDKGVDCNMKITMRMHNISAETVLSLGLTASADLAFFIDDDGVIFITTKGPASVRVVERHYDVAELLTPAVHFPGDDPSISSRIISGDNMPSSNKYSGDCFSADDLIHIIKDTIEYESWGAGGECSIEAVGARLIVKQSLSVHNRIAAFLKDLNRVCHRQIAVGGLAFEVADPTLASHLRKSGRTVLSPDETTTLIESLVKTTEVKWINRFLVTCRNGQRMNTVNGTQATYCKDIDPQIAGDSIIMDRIIDVINNGISVDIYPVLSYDESEIFIELRTSITSREEKMRRIAFKDNQIDLPDQDIRRVRTSVKIPNGGSVLFGLSGGKTPDNHDSFLLCTASALPDPSPREGANQAEMSRTERNNIATKEKLSTLTMSATFNNATFKDVIDNIATETGINCVVDAEVHDVPTISLVIKNIKAKDALQFIILDSCGLDYKIVDGCLLLASKKKIRAMSMATHIYDLSDFRFPITNFPSARSDLLPTDTYKEKFGGSSSAFAGTFTLSRESSDDWDFDDFVDKIKRLSEEGEDDSPANIEEHSGYLFVKHTEAMHNRIRQILSQERAAQKRTMISVDCRVVTVDDATTNKVLYGERTLSPIVDEKRLVAILDSIAQNDKSRIRESAILHCFNGQRANLVCGKGHAYLQDIDSQTGTFAGIEDPIINMVLDGIILDIHPIMGADGIVELTLRGNISLLQAIHEKSVENGETIQCPEVKLCRIETTVNIPDGKTVVYALGNNQGQTYLMMLTAHIGK